MIMDFMLWTCIETLGNTGNGRVSVSLPHVMKELLATNNKLKTPKSLLLVIYGMRAPIMDPFNP